MDEKTESKSIFDLDEYKHLRAAYEARKRRFAKNWRYYKAEYSGADTKTQTAAGNYVTSLIEASIKPLFTPLARAVNIDVSLIPGGWQLTEESQQAAFGMLLKESRWEIEGDIFVRYGVAMGESGLRIVDDRINKRVYLAPIRPDRYVTQSTSVYDPTPALAIFIDMSVDADGEDVEWAEVITPSTIATFKNGEPMGRGDREASYDNALGFVPLVVAVHDIGDGVGEPTFDDSIVALDQVNRQATYMAQMIERHAEPQWAAIGAEAGDLEKSGDAVWFFPEGSDIKAILAAVDFAGLLAFIKEVKEEMKEGLPELAFSKLTGVNRIAAATIELQMAEAVFKIRRLRKYHDQALADAAELAALAAKDMGLDVGSLHGADIELDSNRPVITIDALTRIEIETARQGQEATAMALAQQKILMEGDQRETTNPEG